MNRTLPAPPRAPDPARDSAAAPATARTPADASEGCRIWVDDEARFTPRRFSPIRHDYHRHSLMQVESLHALAQRLFDKGQCRFMKPGTTLTSAFNLATRSVDGRDLDRVFAEIETPGSWVALYNVETDPLYRQFLWDALASVRHLVKEEGEVFDAHGFIFISAPPSVTPFHIDRENNFWLQLRGRKLMSVFDRTDRELVAQKDLEEFIVWRTLDNVKLKPEHRSRATEYDVGPGDGVYFPSTTPHMTTSGREWTSPGDGLTISIGVNFYTDVTRRAANVHACNRVLRRLGLNPLEPGRNALLDRVKYPIGRAIVAAHRRLRPFVPPPGFL